MNILGWVAIIILALMNVCLMTRISVLHKNQKEIVEVVGLTLKTLTEIVNSDIKKCKEKENGKD